MGCVNKTFETPSNLPIHMIGPSIEEGPLPAFFYFALSGADSLHLDPYNQPVAFLKDHPIRCFSFTLPFHGEGFDNNTAMSLWANEFIQNPNFLNEFLDKCQDNILFLEKKGLLNTNKMAVGGLSRGGFIATHLAARETRFSHLLGFAPMTKLKALAEMEQVGNAYDLILLTERLINTKVRFYIGNRDLRVGTRACFDFIEKIVESAYQKGKRSATTDLIITSSHGFKGHGTLPPTFQAGINWLIDQLCRT